MTRYLMLAVLVLVGCATAKESIGVRGVAKDEAGLQDATQIAWEAYGRTDRPPVVLLVEGEALSCTDPVSGKPGFPVTLVTGKTCREGYTLTPWEVSVAWHGEPWSQTVLAHELLHAAMGRSGIVDTDHTRLEWKMLLPAVRADLEGRGL